jgi:cytoskeletal protein RodZ
MHGARMKRLILIPITFVTGLLVVAFLAPSAAASAARTIAPAVSAAVSMLPGVQLLSAQQGSLPGTPSSSLQTQANSSGASASTSGTAAQTPEGQGIDSTMHTLSTPSQVNCGRFGNGFHGGKHDFTCPNRPFPVTTAF